MDRHARGTRITSTSAAEESLQTLTLHLPDAAATTRVGVAIAPLLVGGMVVALQGDLGAGKTTLARGVLRALGVSGPIKSPSYALVEHYPLSSIYFYHLDFYRFDNPAEWETAGLAECFRADSVCLIEWPEHVAALLPPFDLTLALSPASSTRDGRTLVAHAGSKAGERCVSAIEAASVGRRTPD
jgi:tRNA threonylcarbamoyladenosine biosynthesis protein TsaE